MWTPLNPNGFRHQNHFYCWWKWYLLEFHTVNRFWIIQWQAGHLKRKADFCEDNINRALFHRNTIGITLKKLHLIFPKLSIHLWSMNILKSDRCLLSWVVKNSRILYSKTQNNFHYILRILLVWWNHPPLAFFRFIRCFLSDLFSGFTWWTVGGSLINGAKTNCKK